MASICQVAMKEGAIGLSSGLEYVPSCHASTSELITLCRAIGDAGGIYVSHIRYQDGLIPALQEAIEIGRRARVPVHVSHLRGDRDVGVSSEDVLEVVDLARIEGIDVSFDMYPYSYGCTFLPYALPPWLFQGTVRDIMARLRGPEVRDRIRAWLPSSTWSWSDATIAGHLNEAYCAYVGLDLLSASQLADADLVDFVCDILIAHKLEILLIWKPNDSPAMTADLSAMLRHPAHTLGSDGVYKQGRVHPRGFGAFARFIGRYVREESLLSFEEAIRHVTSAPARRFNLSGRGEIRDGFIADLVVFDPHTFIDRATYETGSLLAEGVRDVIVNGVTAMRDGWPTGATPGRGIRGLGCNHRLSHCSSRRNNPSINDRAAR
jgi:N-acyl-D-amino-acid deacylase